MWVIRVSYMCELYIWVIRVWYACELYVWVIHVSYMCELYMWVICVRYTCELYVSVGRPAPVSMFCSYTWTTHASLHSNIHAYNIIHCQIQIAITFCFIVMSVMHVIFMNIDRYVYIINSFLYQRYNTRLRTLVCVASIWPVLLPVLGLIFLDF